MKRYFSLIIFMLVVTGVIGLQPKRAGAYDHVEDHVCFNYDDLENVQKEILDKGTHKVAGDHAGPDFEKFEATLHKDKFSSERCAGDDSPYRYWYFLKSWKKKTPHFNYWHTVKFKGTLKPIDTSDTGGDWGLPVDKDAYNSLQKNLKKVDVLRIETNDDDNDGLITCKHDVVCWNNVNYHLCIYKVDIKDWFDALNQDELPKWLYLQPITEIKNPKGEVIRHNLTKLTDWIHAMQETGFTTRTPKQAHNHYNQRIPLYQNSGNLKIHISRTEFGVNKSAADAKDDELKHYQYKAIDTIQFKKGKDTMF